VTVNGRKGIFIARFPIRSFFNLEVWDAPRRF
jgi:hypothetical protein